MQSRAKTRDLIGEVGKQQPGSIAELSNQQKTLAMTNSPTSTPSPGRTKNEKHFPAKGALESGAPLTQN